MSKEWRKPLVLFILTVFTTTLTGTAYVGADITEWWKGLSFSLPLIFILLTHEMGHYLAAKKHNVDVSPPYFIPLPPSFGIGTMGAVIKIRDRITSRNALMDIGAAGPLAGIIAALPILIYGIYMSPVTEIPRDFQGITEGNSILYLSLKYLIHGTVLPDANRDIMMHPSAFAGWIGLLVTMINLIPVGQLDGGHVFFAKFGDKYSSYSSTLHTSLPFLGILVTIYVAGEDFFFKNLNSLTEQVSSPSLFDSLMTGLSSASPWFVWSIILIVLKFISGGTAHPPVGKDPLTYGRKITAYAIIILMILIFMPVPMRVS